MANKEVEVEVRTKTINEIHEQYKEEIRKLKEKYGRITCAHHLAKHLAPDCRPEKPLTGFKAIKEFMGLRRQDIVILANRSEDPLPIAWPMGVQAKPMALPSRLTCWLKKEFLTIRTLKTKKKLFDFNGLSRATDALEKNIDENYYGRLELDKFTHRNEERISNRILREVTYRKKRARVEKTNAEKAKALEERLAKLAQKQEEDLKKREARKEKLRLQKLAKLAEATNSVEATNLATLPIDPNIVNTNK